MAKLNVKYLAVHCSATKPSMDVGAAEIDRWHRAEGWFKIGYHYVIRRNGKIEKGRPESEIGAHVSGYNSVSLGVCLVGGCDDRMKAANNFTPAQFESLRTLLTELKTRYPEAIIQGHRDFPNVKKDCPSFDVKKWWSEL